MRILSEVNAKLIDEARTQTNEKKRLTLYHKAIKRQHDQAFMAWLINANDVWGMSKRIKWQPRVDAQFKAWEISFK